MGEKWLGLASCIEHRSTYKPSDGCPKDVRCRHRSQVDQATALGLVCSPHANLYGLPYRSFYTKVYLADHTGVWSEKEAWAEPEVEELSRKALKLGLSKKQVHRLYKMDPKARAVALALFEET